MKLNLSKLIVSLYLLIFIFSCTEQSTPVGKMPPVLKMNQMAPDFIFQTMKDSMTNPELNTKRLSQLQGKVIYLDFWASWCKPCLKSMPLLNQMRANLIDEEFEVIAINLDNKPELGIKFVQQNPVDYPVVRAEDDTIFQLYQINGLPTSYLLDKEGVLRYVHQGFKEKDMDKIRQQVMLLLKRTKN